MRRLIDRRLLKSLWLTVSLLAMLAIPSLHAQDKCDPEVTLTLANDEFNAGHFYGLEAILKPCLETNTFTKEQRVRAYQLLTQTYLILENPLAAEDSYLKLLEANPEYVSSPDRDPIDVVYLSKKFTATPIFSWFAHAAGNVTMPRVITDHNVTPGSRQQYSIRPRWALGGGIIWNYNDRLTAELGLDFVNTSYGYFQDKIFTDDNLTMTEDQLALHMPLSVKYTYIRKGLSPYAYAGLSGSALLSANQNFLVVDRTPGETADEGFAEQTTELDIDVAFRRDVINRAAHVGAGFRWKYKLDYLFVDVRYSFGLNNVVRQDRLIRDYAVVGSDEPTFAAGYVDDFFRLDQAMISVGYIKPLYKPRKLKRARSTRGVLKDVKEQDND